MKTRRLPLLALLCGSLLALTACEDATDEGADGTDGGGDGSGVTSHIEATIKTVSSPAKNFLKSDFSSGDAISISASSASATLFGSAKFTYDGSDWHYGDIADFEMTATSDEYTFSALCPAPDSDDAQVSYDLSQSSDPLLFASTTVSSSVESVELLFVHQLCELVMVFSDPDIPDADEIIFEANMIHTLSIDRVSGEVSYGSAATSQIKMQRSDIYPARYYATMAPQTITSYSIIKDGVQYYSNSLSNSITLTSGGSLSYTAVLEESLDGGDIEGVIVDTQEWVDGNNGDYELDQLEQN
ncbi:MAG: fimbrillin family protein [Rikenellaceae bacterium]